MTESQAVTKLMSYLKPYGKFWKISDRHRAGIPDVIGLRRGRFAGIEVKVDDNVPTPLQIYELTQITLDGGYAAVLTYTNKHKTWVVNNERLDKTTLLRRIVSGVDAPGYSEFRIEDYTV